MSDARSRDQLAQELKEAQEESEAAARAFDEARQRVAKATRTVTRIRRALGRFVWSAEEVRERAERRVWRTGHGAEVAYSDMDADHLRAAIETAPFDVGHPALPGLREELARRGMP